MASTIPGEPVFLVLSLTSDIDKDLVNKKKSNTEVNLKNVTCRHCEGPHWTATCPFKDIFSADALKKKTEGLKLDSGDASSNAASTSGKYVPPSQRAREQQSQSSGTTSQVQSEPSQTIRISNLSDIVTDQDVRFLCSALGNVSRVYLAKDKITGASRGFAFVTFQSMLDAERAATKLNGHLYGNMVLSVSMAEDRK